MAPTWSSPTGRPQSKSASQSPRKTHPHKLCRFVEEADITLVEFSNYLYAVERACHEHPEWRLGQTYFNILFRMDPVLADSIRSGKLDPFYLDKRIPEFLKFVLNTVMYQEMPNPPTNFVGEGRRVKCLPPSVGFSF